MDLIEREALFAALCSKCSGPYLRNVSSEECREEICATKDTIMAAPAVDAVLVVRCKDCVFSKPNDGKLVEGARYCSLKYDVAGLSYFDVWDNDYCSCGKRKEVQEVRDEDG